MSESIDLRGTQGVVVQPPGGTVVQHYEAEKSDMQIPAHFSGEQLVIRLHEEIRRHDMEIIKLRDEMRSDREDTWRWRESQLAVQETIRAELFASMKSILEEVARSNGSIQSNMSLLASSIASLAMQAARLPPRRNMVFTVAWLFLFMPVTLLFSEVRVALNITWYIAFALSIISYSISATIFAYLFGLFANQ